MDFTVENILIPADHPCFEGHFPGHPVFPAVAQIDLLQKVISQKLGQEVIVTEVRKAKFLSPILPDMSLHVSCQIQKDFVAWRISSNEKVCSSGNLLIHC